MRVYQKHSGINSQDKTRSNCQNIQNNHLFKNECVKNLESQISNQYPKQKVRNKVCQKKRSYNSNSCQKVG